MRLLEYQGKELFKEFGIPIPKSRIAFSVEEARLLLNSELIFPIVLKSQVPVGGRGKAGAIKKCQNMDEVEKQFSVLQNKKIEGEFPRGLLLEEVISISKELYVSLFLNRSTRCFSLIVSAAGGMEIESAENRFIEYEEQIRREYSWVPEEIFMSKRAEILERFLARKVIYRTPKFHDTHEKQARANLSASLKRLRNG